MHNTLIAIPVRLGSSRLPNKPLALINGKPMMICVAEIARASNVGDVILACAEQELVEIANQNGYTAVLTDPSLPSGSDRIHAALSDLSKKYDYIINLQGDMPTADPELIGMLLKKLENSGADIVTAVAEIKEVEENQNPNVVKAIVGHDGKALYFTRTASVPYGNGPLFHHIGIYAYKADALNKFVSLPPSALEQREKLEQLRALENDMSIYAVTVEKAPKGVDTAEDLEVARKELTFRQA